VISRFAKSDFVDGSTADQSSILRFIGTVLLAGQLMTTAIWL
jgi:hypothetical protein